MNISQVSLHQKNPDVGPDITHPPPYLGQLIDKTKGSPLKRTTLGLKLVIALSGALQYHLVY
jgi:hypothetical protein